MGESLSFVLSFPSKNCANLQNQSLILKCLLSSLLLSFLYVENFQKTVLSHIDSDETGSWPIHLNELRTSETNCNQWSLIKLWEGLCVCACGSRGWNRWSKKTFLSCILFFCEIYLSTGPFLHFTFFSFLIVSFSTEKYRAEKMSCFVRLL